MKTFETMQDAVRVASEILEGSIDPYLGCGLIGRIGEKLNHTAFLGEFVHLAHLQEGHENFGFTKESCLPGIMAACHELLAVQA